MPFMPWSDQLSVGIKDIDTQHKKLVDMLNELNDGMVAGKANDVLGKILKGLVDYCKTHFTKEELLMKTHQYPDFDKHRKEHEDLVVKAVDILNKFNAGTALPVQTLVFLKDWLQKHIMGTDKKYGPYLNQKGVK